MTILNLTQHQATNEQVSAGVVEPHNKAEVQKLLTFHTLPSKEELDERAKELAMIAKSSGTSIAMIGGAPFFMSCFERALVECGITPLYAFSERVSVETTNDDGTVTKQNVFKHVGFVNV